MRLTANLDPVARGARTTADSPGCPPDFIDRSSQLEGFFTTLALLAR
jgi:hypothetical protein